MVKTYSRVQNNRIAKPVKDYIEYRLYHHTEYLNDYTEARQELKQNNGNGTTASSVLFQGIDVKAISRAIDSNALYQELYSLHYEQRLSGAEVADRMGISVSLFRKLRRGLIMQVGCNMGIVW